MAAVIDVAQCILEMTGPISSWKLQKLVYYCQAWHSVWEDKPLFNERVEAWANGPVCRDLYDRHRGRFIVDAFEGADCNRLNADERETVEKVVGYYREFDGQQLSDLTHMEAPWKNARAGMAPSERGNAEITLEAMSEYYGSLAEVQVFEDKSVKGYWRVEFFDEDGACYVVIFAGPDAEGRAREYAAWKYNMCQAKVTDKG